MEKVSVRRREGFIFLCILLLFFGYLGSVMGIKNLLSTIMKTAHYLLLNTVFYIMSITVLSGALGKLMIEFGVVRLIESILNPIMKPIFRLPGMASLGAIMSFFSDNPAVLSLATDENFSCHFTKKELMSFTNFGTAFGMGLIVMTFMIGKGFILAAFVGFAGAIIGAFTATRVNQKIVGKYIEKDGDESAKICEKNVFFKSKGSLFLRFINAILDGGKSGVDLGLVIIPGVLIISSFMMIITLGPKNAAIGYQGLPMEGVPILPLIAEKFEPVLKILFGFKHAEAVAFPITSMGAVGAALSLIPTFLEHNVITGNDIAVFTAMGMCWSGFVSSQPAMMDALNTRHFTSKVLFAQFVGGIAAGIAANYFYKIVILIMN